MSQVGITIGGVAEFVRVRRTPEEGAVKQYGAPGLEAEYLGDEPIAGARFGLMPGEFARVAGNVAY